MEGEDDFSRLFLRRLGPEAVQDLKSRVRVLIGF
jgi:hypothetical protein